MRIHRANLGMYPDETCFDTTRPSWLPYWLDDFQETACAANELLVGNPTGNTTQAGDPGAEASTVANTKTACLNNGDNWSDATSTCAPSLIHQLGPYAIAGGIGIVALLLLLRK